MGAALCCGGDRNRVYQEQATTSVIRAADSPPPIGKLLIFVNPNSGAGKGVKTFHSKVKGQLQKNNIDYELVITNGPNHARGIVSTREDIMDFKGIVILSGDGLVYEILNGFTERPDAAEVIPRLPLAVVPSGSGNGLLASLFASKGYSLNNPAFTNQAIMIATAPQPTAEPVNLIRVQTTSENIAAFLSIGWGLMADIDIESEKYRKTLGSNRFTVSALVRTMKLRTYKGKLSYKPYLPSTSTRQDPKSFSVYGDHIFASDDPSPLRVTSSSPRKTDPFWDLQDSGQELSLEDPVPSDWLTIDEEFVGVYAMSLSHIAQDGHFMPGAKMFDDKIYLSYMLKKDVKGKSQLVKMLLGIEKGTHVDLQFFKTVQVSAFRLEPEDPNPLLVVDGEVVETTHLQASVTDLRTVIFT